MLKIEVIRFEAQDVITASAAKIECTCEYKYNQNHPKYPCTHEKCPAKGKIDDKAHKCWDEVVY